MPEPPKIYIGFITYGKSTSKYLPYFLPSLKAQTYGNFDILVVDNSEAGDEENSNYLKNNFPEIKLIRSEKNLGFAKAFNLMIKEAIDNDAVYFMPLNPDMILEPDMVENLVKAMRESEHNGAVQAKIFKWDFENNIKTAQIDSLGLAVNKEHRFYDAHQGEADDKSKNQPFEVFGFTGAAVLLNLEALKDIAFDNGNYKEYFDELMFMYKEDCDLSYRLRLAGWKAMLAPDAVVYHNRMVASKGESNLKIVLNRLNKNKQVKKWAFLNHWILLLKLKNLPFSWRVKLGTAWYQFKSLVFVLLFEQYLLKELLKLWKLRPEIKKRRERLKIRVSIKEIEKFIK